MTEAYYNELDAFPAQWLRNLAAAGKIAPGRVDDRSIHVVAPEDVGAGQAHFFAGLGAWSYALRLAGWPDDLPVWTGSCPCQPFSEAGKGLGLADERHLWPVWFDLIRKCRPRCILAEQVASQPALAWLDIVQSDLEGAGYSVGAIDIPACGVGAPHIRNRLWIVALANDDETGWRQQWRERVRGHREASRRNDADGCSEDGGSARVSVADNERVGWRSGRAAEPGEASGGRALGEPPGHSLAGVVANIESCGRGEGRQETSGDRTGAADDSGDSCVADSVHSGCGSSVEPIREGQPHADRSCATVRMGDPGSTGGRRHARAVSGAEGEGGRERLESGSLVDEPESSGAVERMEDADEPDPVDRGQQGSGRFVQPSAHASARDPWRGCEWVWCTDGKWRPTEPGTFPLSHGSPSRVGRLRAFGNAITAPLAARFIEAVMELL